MQVLRRQGMEADGRKIPQDSRERKYNSGISRNTWKVNVSGSSSKLYIRDISPRPLTRSPSYVFANFSEFLSNQSASAASRSCPAVVMTTNFHLCFLYFYVHTLARIKITVVSDAKQSSKAAKKNRK